MQIVILTSEIFSEFPPLITMVEVLEKLGHEVVCLTITKDKYLSKNTDIVNYYLKENSPFLLEKTQNKKIIGGICFRIDNLTKKLLMRKAIKSFKNIICQADVVWVAHERTIVNAGKAAIRNLPSYVYSMYELPLRLENNKHIDNYKEGAKKAKAVIVPEYCRAHIIKAIYQLDNVPFIIPNKALYHPQKRNIYIEDETCRNIINQIRYAGKKIIMYMGILSKERPLEAIIEAVHNNDKYEFVVLGSRTRYLSELESKYNNWFYYLGSVNPPKHLQVASYADIAYVCYVPQGGSVNAVFCAPNKVYEFAGFGIPLLCNEVPGLKFEVESNGFGVCIPEINTQAIEEAIDNIEENYDTMCEKAHRYYNSINVEALYKGIIDKLQN